MQGSKCKEHFSNSIFISFNRINNYYGYIFEMTSQSWSTRVQDMFLFQLLFWVTPSQSFLLCCLLCPLQFSSVVQLNWIDFVYVVGGVALSRPLLLGIMKISFTWLLQWPLETLDIKKLDADEKYSSDFQTMKSSLFVSSQTGFSLVWFPQQWSHVLRVQKQDVELTNFCSNRQKQNQISLITTRNVKNVLTLWKQTSWWRPQEIVVYIILFIPHSELRTIIARTFILSPFCSRKVRLLSSVSSCHYLVTVPYVQCKHRSFTIIALEFPCNGCGRMLFA